MTQPINHDRGKTRGLGSLADCTVQMCGCGGGAVLVLEQWEEKGKRELSSSDIEQWPRAQRLLWLPALPHWENLSWKITFHISSEPWLSL